MGSNRRYAERVDERMSQRVVEAVARDAQLATLSSEELRLDTLPLTIDPSGRRKVRAWVRFGQTPAQVDAVAVRWTPSAVGISFDVGGREHRCWVWVGAVDEAE